MRVSIAGGTGYLGQFVTRHLLELGHEVQLLTTSTGLRWQEPVRIRVLRYDDPSALEDALCNQDALVQCAFSHIPGRYRGGEGDDPVGFWQANLSMTLGLLEAARAGAVRRVVLCSSRAVFDGHPATPQRLGDTAEVLPTSHYGALKAAEEHLARVYSTNDELTVSCIRPTGIYGLIHPASKSKWFELLAAWRHRGKLPEPRNASEVHGRDVAAAILLLLTGDPKRLAGRTFNCSDVVTGPQELLDLAADWLGVESPVLPAAPPALRIQSCEGLRELGWQPGGQPLLKQTVAELLSAQDP